MITKNDKYYNFRKVEVENNVSLYLFKNKRKKDKCYALSYHIIYFK